MSLEEETPVKQVKRLASQKQASIAKVREGTPRGSSETWARPAAWSVPECAEAWGGPAPGAQRPVLSGSPLWPWAPAPTTPILLVFGFQKKKVEKEEEAVR